jgi:hypothetical protein
MSEVANTLDLVQLPFLGLLIYIVYQKLTEVSNKITAMHLDLAKHTDDKP